MSIRSAFSSAVEAPLTAMAENLVDAMRCFGAARPETQELSADGLVRIAVGPAAPLFNCAIVTAGVETTERLESHLRAAQGFFGAAPYCLWLCEGLLSPPVRRMATALCQRHGLSAMTRPPGMIAREFAAPVRTLPGVKIRRVSDPASRQSFLHIMSASFDGPLSQLRAVYGEARLWETAMTGYLASLDGLDVAAGAVVAGHGALGIYAVGTLPGFRRRGYAEALMRHAVAEAAHTHGPLPIVLQSSAAALRLYRRLGFDTVTHFSVYSAG